MTDGMNPDVSKRFDDLDKAIEGLSKKIDSSEDKIEMEIKALPGRLSDTCAHTAKRISTILAWTMFGIIAAFAIPTIFWMLRGRKIEVCEVWLFSILFVSFCAFGLVLIRILVRRNND